MCRGFTDFSEDAEVPRSRRSSRCGSIGDGAPLVPCSRRGSRFGSRCGPELETRDSDDGCSPAPDTTKLEIIKLDLAAAAALAAAEAAVPDPESSHCAAVLAPTAAAVSAAPSGRERPASPKVDLREGRRVAFGPYSPCSSSQPSARAAVAAPSATAAAAAPAGSQVAAQPKRREAGRGILKLDSPVATRSASSSSSGPQQPPQLRQEWTALESELFRASKGLYEPSEMARRRRVGCSLPGAPFGTGSRLEVVGRVSMVTPTMSSRQKYHEALWASFEAQTVEDKELVVLETYEDTPSAFLQAKAKEDSRLVHVCIKVPADGDFSVGLKRNMTLHLASGEYVVNFDDDDLYSAGYAEAMVSEMMSRGLYGVTLSSWHNFYSGSGECTYSDPGSWGEWASDEAELDAILYGYGFSYAHRRQVSLDYPYPDVCFAEDAPFFLKLRKVLGEDKVVLKRDDQGLCMHIMHRANSAQVLGTRTITSSALRSLAVWHLEPFQRYLQAVPPGSGGGEGGDDSRIAAAAGGVGDVLAAALQLLGLARKTSDTRVARRALRGACA